MAEYIGLVGTEPAQAVWDANYMLAMHMNDAPGDPTTVLDSTSNANHGTKGAGDAAPTEVDGLAGKAQSFDGEDSQYISILHDVAFNIIDSITIESAIKITSYPTTDAWICRKGNGWGALLSSGRLGFWGSALSDQYIGYGVAIAVDEHYALAVAYDKKNAIIYVNGGINYTQAETNALSTDALNLGIGRRGSTNIQFFYGLISELRISNTARGAGWISGTNLSLRDLLIRYEQKGSHRFKMVIPAGKVSEDLSDFPVYINVGAAAGLSGTDLRALLDKEWWRGLCVRANDGSYCYIENVSWDPVTGYAQLHTKLPEILTGSDNYYHLMIERTGMCF